MRDIGRAELQVLIDKGAQIVEVLPKAAYDEDHLLGAINLPLRKIETDARGTLDLTRPVVVYCWDAA